MLSQLESSSVLSRTICSLLCFFLFFLLPPPLSFSNNLHSPLSLIAKQAVTAVRDRERLEERSRDAVSAWKLLFHVSNNLFSSFLLFFLSSSPLLSFSYKFHSPLSLIAKQANKAVRDRERLEERSRDAVSAWKLLLFVSYNLFSCFPLSFLPSFPPSFVLEQPPFSTVSYCKTGGHGERSREARGAHQKCFLSLKLSPSCL